MDGDKTNNRIENLRDCSQSENNCNKLLEWRPNPQTQLPGVFITTMFGRQCYAVKIRGKRFGFKNPYEAFTEGTLCGKTYK